MDQSYLPFLYVVSQKMVHHFYVLGFRMKNWVLCNTYGIGAVTLKWNMVTPGFKDKPHCINTCAPGSSFTHALTQ
jgi:hypothetical protein